MRCTILNRPHQVDLNDISRTDAESEAQNRIAKITSISTLISVSITLTKSVKKEIVKNHLEGLNDDENLGKLTSGNQLDRETLRSAIDEFSVELQKDGLSKASRAYGVSRLANELGEVAAFRHKNGVELEDMIRGAKVARVLKNYGAGIPDLEQFLSTAYSRASRQGYTAETLVAQISSLDNLEKKYGKSFDALKDEYTTLGKDIKSKQIERNNIIGEIAKLKKQNSELLAQHQVDVGRLSEYAKTKQTLLSLGFATDNLFSMKNFLLVVKAQGFDPAQVISKINSIGDLEKQGTKLEQETKVANDELLWKKALLNELRKLQETNLSVEQIDKIQKIVVRIATQRGLDPSTAYFQFEEDIINNYDSVFGIKSAISSLKENEERLVAEVNKKKQELVEVEVVHSNKLKKIEEKYSKIVAEIGAYNSLQEMGVDGNRILGWHQIMESSGLDFGTVESQLKNYANLKNIEQDIKRKIEVLTSEAASLRETVENLSREKASVESSIGALGETSIAAINSTSSKILSSISSLSEQASSTFTQMSSENERALDSFRASSEQDIKKIIGESGETLKSTVTQLNSSVADFAIQLKKVIDEAVPQIKNVSAALEAGERLGKYKNILPLLELSDEKNVSESQALIAMWNVTSRFNSWFAEHHRTSPKPEISVPLSKLVASINEEIQRIN